MNISDLVPIKDRHIKYCENVDLYYEAYEGNFVLYKPAGRDISDVRVNSGKHPTLFVNKDIRKQVVVEAQQQYNRKLEEEIKKGDIQKVRDVMVRIVEDTIVDPLVTDSTLITDTMNVLIGQYVDQPQNLKAIASLSFKDYTTAIHSINVMALTVVYCFHVGYSMEETLNMGLGALFHDIGKTRISSEILTAARKLSEEEFDIMRSHTLKGYALISDSDLDTPTIRRAILQHHEKLDGSGYPNRITDVSTCGQIIGIIDCYEALTNESRPYRNAAPPLDALRIIKEDVGKGKFSNIIFEQFAYSLI